MHHSTAKVRSNWPRIFRARLCFAFTVLQASHASASVLTDPAEYCDAAARHVAGETNVPLDVLRAITRTETGRGTADSIQPWPWTVNMQGKGVWFDTEDQARVYVFHHFKKGARSFDVGCFQINYRWHHKGFNSIEEMFDPMLNARYAAKFLTQLNGELGSWDKAVGAYHSRTRKYAERYLARYEEVRENLPTSKSMPPLAPVKTRAPVRNRGSLALVGASNARSLFDKESSQ